MKRSNPLRFEGRPRTNTSALDGSTAPLARSRRGLPASPAAVALSVGLFATAVAASDEPIVGDRPDFTESAVTVPRGAFQLEAGLTRTDFGPSEELAVGEALVRFGLTERLEIRALAPSYVDVDLPGMFLGVGDDSGLSDSAVGVKFEIGDPDGPFDWAILADTTLPTGDDGFGSDDPQPTAKVLFGVDLTEGLSLGVNAGYTRAQDGSEKFDQWSASASLAIAATEKFGVFVEAFGFSEEVPDGSSTTLYDGGVTYLLTPTVQLDARIGFGGSDSAVDSFVGAGIVKRW